MAKLLLVEDDRELCVMLSDTLSVDKHDVEYVHTGAESDHCLKNNQYDLLVLDWDLPDTTGIEICKKFRASGGRAPILMLTGRDGVDEKGEGFESGADDYLTKPFLTKELLMRVRALLRRSAPVPQATNVEGSIPQIGSVIDGKYKLLEFIGQGGMSSIYKATHLGLQKTVVVKVIQAHLLESDNILERFQQECLAVAKIKHGNVVAAFDNGLTNGKQPYLVLEYIAGESLSQLIARKAPLPLSEALEIIIQVCHGLEAAHQAGVIHRDLKPDNILLQEKKDEIHWVKIVDFGLALLSSSAKRFTQADVLMGSAGYLTPEQLRGLPLDERVDIYVLGVILFEMLSNELPFRANNTEAFLIKQLLEEPEIISNLRTDILAGSPVEQVIAKALEKNREQRYQTVAELRIELEKLR